MKKINMFISCAKHMFFADEMQELFCLMHGMQLELRLYTVNEPAKALRIPNRCILQAHNLPIAALSALRLQP